MKILFLSYKFYPVIGGIEVNSEVLATEFQKAGHEVRLLTTTRCNQDQHKEFPFVVIRSPDTLTILKAHFWADVIFENNTCLGLSWPAYVFGLRLVVAIRTWIERNDGTITLTDKTKIRLLNRARKVIAVSEAVRQKTFKKAVVIGNPYRRDIFKILPSASRVKSFAFLGRLVSTKGAKLAVDAFNQLVKSDAKYQTLTLTIIGDGPEQDNLEKQIAGYNLTQNVAFTGALRGSKLTSVLNEHQIILVPSLWKEPFGNVALEGMACGCVPIVSDEGGLTDAVGNAGMVFKRGSQESLLECMQEIITKPDLLNTLRGNAAKHLEAHYPEKVAQQYLNVIKSAAGEGK